MKIRPQPFIKRAEEIEVTEVKRVRRVFWFFDVERWETVSNHHVGSDLHINTLGVNNIRNIILDGKTIPL